MRDLPNCGKYVRHNIGSSMRVGDRPDSRMLREHIEKVVGHLKKVRGKVSEQASLELIPPSLVN